MTGTSTAPLPLTLSRRLAGALRCRAGALALALACLCLLGTPARVQAAPRAQEKGIIELEVGASQLLRPTAAIERVVVGEPSVCDVENAGGGALIITAKQAGETSLAISLRDGTQPVYRIVASMPTTALSQALRQAFPQEERIVARSVGGAVFLAGTASDAAVVEAAGRLAQSIYQASGRKMGEIVNLLEVSTPQQVQVHLRFVEISRTNMRAMGFNGWFNNSTKTGALFGPNAPQHHSTLSDTLGFSGPANPAPATGQTVQSGQPNANPYLPLLVSPVTGSFALSFAATDLFSNFPLSLTLGLLEQRGVAKTLSEPTLVAISGKQAKFLVGGEFPVPIPSTIGQISIQFKPYGAQLAFTPVIVGDDTINLEVESQVSDIDRANGVNISSVQVPALSSRQSHTTVRLRDGQSFAIAGLLSDKISNTQSNVPGLGDIPLLGALFRNVNSQRQELELMVMVTVNLVKPLEANQMTPSLNRDEFTEPSSLELFVMGYREKASSSQPERAKASSPRRGPAHAMNEPDGLVGFSR